MQAYGPSFARVYNRGWSDFARGVAPLIYGIYVATPSGRANRPVLDVGCGTGVLANFFLNKGFRVIGIDLSEEMLRQAREDARPFIASGQARFIQHDVVDFQMDERVGLVVATYDVLSHLEDEHTLRRAFEGIYRICDEMFVFDLSTRLGLRQWSSIRVDDSSEEAVVISRGSFDEQGGRGWSRLSGFFRTESGLYERFDQTFFNTAHEMVRVRNALLEVGWETVHFARAEDLNTPIQSPEAEHRVFFVARKHASSGRDEG